MAWDWQLTMTLVLILLASCYLVRRGWRLWRGRKKGCAGGCGCAASAAEAQEKQQIVPISLEKLMVRRRQRGQG
jgi:hypothetical protein